MTAHTRKERSYRKAQYVFFATLSLLLLGSVLWMIIQARQFRNTAYRSLQQTIPPPTSQDSTANWYEYKNTYIGFSFKYPSDLLKVTEEPQLGKSDNLLTKITLTPLKEQTTSVTILVWKAPKTSLTKDTIESWCKKIPRGEAAEQKVLCALLSPPAIAETTIFGKTLYSTKYYSSFNDRTDFFVIPEKKYLFTVQLVTANNTQSQLPLLQILSTFKFLPPSPK